MNKQPGRHQFAAGSRQRRIAVAQKPQQRTGGHRQPGRPAGPVEQMHQHAPQGLGFTGQRPREQLRVERVELDNVIHGPAHFHR
ncbi:hypothetical protein SRRS_36260 [Sporomusa rhizae]